MKQQFGIDVDLLNEIRGAITAQPRIEEVRLYGSRARGDFRPGSDIDLAVRGSEFTFNDRLDLMGRLDDLPLIFSIDIVHLDSLGNPKLKANIERESVPFWPSHQQ